MYGIESVSSISTGVDVEYFAPRREISLIGHGFLRVDGFSPNVDAVEFFLSEVFPLIRDRLPAQH